MVAAVEPKGKGGGAALAAGADAAPLAPKVNGLGGAAEEPKAGCAAAAGAGNDDAPKVKVDWVVAAAAVVVVEAVLANPKPPNVAVVVFWVDACWPKANTFWLAAWASGCVAPKVKVLLLEVVVAAAGAGAGAAAVVVVAAPNWNVLPVLGACVVAELVLVVVGADQFPKRDFTAGLASGCVVGMEPVEAVPEGVLVMPGKTDGATVVLLVDAPNNDGALVEEAVEVGFVAVIDESCPKPELAVTAPKMGLKVGTVGLLSGVGVEEEVVVTAKIGLNPDASRGLVLLTDSELLAGVSAAVVTGFEVVEEVDVLL